MVGLVELIDLLDLAVERSRDVVDPTVRARAAAAADMARRRRGFLGDVLVVALAGGTGSGKSSLLNAIAGEDLVSVSHIRPHTDEAVAWVSDEADVGVGLLLDDLGVDRRIANSTLPSVVLIDLPDLDSVTEWHRHLVEELLPRVDAVIWVFDPIKYHDPAIHRDFLRPLSAYGDQFTFVLNQVDRLAPVDVDLVAAHLRGTLEADGFAFPDVYAVAARPAEGNPIAIDQLRDHLGAEEDTKSRIQHKIALDLRAAAMALAEGDDLWRGNPTGFTALNADAVATIGNLQRIVGRPTGKRLGEALAADSDEDPTAAVTEALWDRGYLGATLTSLGVTIAERINETIDGKV